MTETYLLPSSCLNINDIFIQILSPEVIAILISLSTSLHKRYLVINFHRFLRFDCKYQ